MSDADVNENGTTTGTHPKYAFVGGEWHEVVLSAELVELTAAVERFCAAHERGPIAARVLGDELRQRRHLINLLELEFARTAAEFAATDEYARAGAPGPSEWLRHECHLSGIAAFNAVSVGERVADLPESVEAMNDGRIGFGHLALMASTAGEVLAAHPQLAFDEAPLLTRALEHSVSRFRHDCHDARHAADPDGFLAEHVEAIERRRFELRPDAGGFQVCGFLDGVGGATLRTALEPLAKRNGKADTRLRTRRMADALVELSHYVLDAGTLPSHGGQRPHLQLTATIETLMAQPGAPAADLQLSGRIPGETARRYACDASKTRVLFDSESIVLDVGRAKRVPSAPMRRALGSRDKGCVWPGCDRPAAWTNAHHLEHWAHDGMTELPNLVLVCFRHHTLLHEGGWRMVRSDDGRWLTIPPLPSARRAPRGAEASRLAMKARAPDDAARERVRRFWDRS